MRREFFGPPGDTRWNLARLQRATKHFTHHDIDIRDRERIFWHSSARIASIASFIARRSLRTTKPAKFRWSISM